MELSLLGMLVSSPVLIFIIWFLLRNLSSYIRPPHNTILSWIISGIVVLAIILYCYGLYISVQAFQEIAMGYEGWLMVGVFVLNSISLALLAWPLIFLIVIRCVGKKNKSSMEAYLLFVALGIIEGLLLYLLARG